MSGLAVITILIRGNGYGIPRPRRFRSPIRNGPGEKEDQTTIRETNIAWCTVNSHYHLGFYGMIVNVKAQTTLSVICECLRRVWKIACYVL